MQASGHFQTVIQLHETWQYGKGAADRFLQAHLKNNRYIGSKDRARISALFFSLFRHQRLLDYFIQNAPLDPSPRLRLITHLMMLERCSADQLQLLWGQGAYAPSPLTEDEVSYGLALQTKELPTDPGIRHSTPALFEASLKSALGTTFEHEMAALNQEAPVNLRVNTLKIKREALQKKLATTAIQTTQTTRSPWGLRLEKRGSLQQTFFYKKGYFEIQDEGAQCLVLDTPLPPTKTGTFSVLDYCAGAGGKTLAFAQRFQNKGQFIACDTSEHRLQQSAIRFQRHNLIVETHILPTESLTPYHDKIDLVFVDAPCTGSGTWRRHPELKGLYDQDTFQALRITQQDILTQAAAYVKKGGILAYATCSLLPEENEQQAALFLKQHPEFGLHDAFDAPTKKGRWYTPFSTATDGYYLCCFIRTV